jgi:tetratricopeptide (TPR) repeat protein
MSEEKSAGAETAGTADPIAMGMAMGRATPLVDDELIGYLRDQRHHLHEQLQQIHLDIWEKWLGVFLRLATAIVGVAAAGAVSWLIWQASQSNGLRIEPFSVPPDLAARGLTGEVVATKLLDRLVAMQNQTYSARPAKSYANAWGEHGIKLEIPETGISLSELDSWLREKLGNDARISGEVVRTGNGLTLTARTDDGSSPGVSGAEEGIDALTDKLAEQIYAATQPFRFGMYLIAKNRTEEALVIFRRLALTGDRDDRVWAYSRWGLSVATLSGVDAGLPILKRSIEIEPGSINSYDQIGIIEADKGHWELALQTHRAQLAQLMVSRPAYVAPLDLPLRRQIAESAIALLLGAFHDRLPVLEEMSRKPFPGFGPGFGPAQRARTYGLLRDFAAARAALEELHNMFPDAPRGRLELFLASAQSHLRQDWTAALAVDERSLAFVQQTVRDRSTAATTVTPLVAESLAHLGRFAEAERTIAPTPADCYPCLITRAKIAELQHQSARADFWFARAIAIGPSLPFAENDWGQVSLARGQPDAAIAQFAIANKKSPHFADTLEGWGEALMAKNQSHLALEKFAVAEKFAPNWGRLHLKWGEALIYAGKPEGAKAHFARAAALDLTPSEKSELAWVEHG